MTRICIRCLDVIASLIFPFPCLLLPILMWNVLKALSLIHFWNDAVPAMDRFIESQRLMASLVLCAIIWHIVVICYVQRTRAAFVPTWWAISVYLLVRREMRQSLRDNS